MRLPAILFVAACLVASCGGGASGPGGTSTTYRRCASYNGTLLCQGAKYPNYFQCDSQPGPSCVTAPGPSPDPKQGVWCCEFACSRGDPAFDSTECTGGRAAYYCNTDANVDPATYGCVPGSSSAAICC